MKQNVRKAYELALDQFCANEKKGGVFGADGWWPTKLSRWGPSRGAISIPFSDALTDCQVYKDPHLSLPTFQIG